MRAPLAEFRQIMRVEIGQLISDPSLDSRFRKEQSIRIGGNRKTVWDFDAFSGKLAIHLSQRGILATNKRHVVNADVVKPTHVLRRCRGSLGTFIECHRAHGANLSATEEVDYTSIAIGCTVLG